MPDTIDRTIYKLEIDDSGYIRGVEGMSASTQKLIDVQKKANDTLKASQAVYKEVSDRIKKVNDEYTNLVNSGKGQTDTIVADKLHNLRIELDKISQEQAKANTEVVKNQKAYEDATKAAQEFADVSARANKLQQTTTGGKIPTGSFTEPIPQLPKIDFTNLSGLPQILVSVKDEFEKIAEAVQLAKDRIKDLSESDPEFQQLTVFIKNGEQVLLQYNEAVKLASQSTGDLSQRIQTAQQSLSAINGAAIEELPVEIAKSRKEFDELGSSIAFAELRLKQMNPEDTGFAELAKTIQQGKNVLEQYGNTVQSVGAKHTSLRQQILNNNNELARLEQVGKGATQTYIQLEKETANLTRLYTEQRERVRILASDTRAFDFGKSAVESAVSGFQLYTSIAVLAGGASEKLEKETIQLFAAMQLLTGLEQLANQVKRGGVIATNLQSVAQATYTAVVGASTGALKAFRLALLGTGIGAAVIAIGFLVKKYIEYKDAAEEAAKKQKLFDDALKGAASEYENAVENVNKLRIDIDLAKQGFIDKTKVVNEYNETIGKTTGQVNSLNEAETALNKNADAYIKFTLLKAAANIALQEGAKKAFDAVVQQIKNEEELQSLEKGKGITAGTERGGIEEQTNKIAQEQQKKRIENLKKQSEQDQKDSEDIANDFQKKAAEIAKKFNFNFFQDTKTVKEAKTGAKEIENVFEQERQSLLTKLAQLRNQEANDIDRINEEFAQKLIAEQIRIAKLFKDKKVTADQEKILLNLAVEVNTTELNKAIADARKKIEEARQKLNDQLNNLQSKAALDSINLLQDDFEKRKKLIDFNEQKEIDAQKTATEERLKDLDEEKKLGLITEQEYQRARKIIVTTGEQELNLIVQKFSQERIDLSADIFKKSLEAYQKAITSGDLIRDQDLAAEVSKQADRFFKGQISFQTFQKNITRFQREQESQRRDGELQVLNDELADLDRHLAAVKDTNSKEYQDTKETQEKIKALIAQKTVEDKTKDVEDKNVVTDDRTKQIFAYTDAVGSLAQSVISFWNTANEAEQKALDRSIEIQQRRVDEAQKIAEKGNASYLKAETDRLKELQVARENAARRQLAIDAALQASQLLVGITGAIAKIASGIGAAETIAEIAIIVGALATGYGLVKSLQGNQPRLRTGTTELKRGEHKPGIDTIPAWLTEGEAVIPVEKNKKYKKAVEAIYHEKVPADKLNEFVENYVSKKETYHKNETVDKKDIIHKVVNEVSDKKVTTNEINDILNKRKKNELSNVVSVVKKLVDEKISNREISTSFKNSLVSKNVTIDDVYRYSEIINKIFNEKSNAQNNSIVNRNLSDTVDNYISNKSVNVSTYKSFVENLSKVPAKVLDSFITNYQTVKKTEEFKKLFETKDVTKQITVNTENKKISIYGREDIKKEVIDSSKIKHLAEFVNTYHTIKPIPQPNYEKIKQVNEIKISHDGKLASLLDEQNRLLKENNSQHEKTQKILKTMGMSISMDKRGFAASWMEFVEQENINKRL